jgi:hypothetical protein
MMMVMTVQTMTMRKILWEDLKYNDETAAAGIGTDLDDED